MLNEQIIQRLEQSVSVCGLICSAADMLCVMKTNSAPSTNTDII